MLSQFVFVLKVKTSLSPFGPHEISVLIELALRNYVLIQHVWPPQSYACVRAYRVHVIILPFFRTKTTCRKVGVELYFFTVGKIQAGK